MQILSEACLSMRESPAGALRRCAASELQLRDDICPDWIRAFGNSDESGQQRGSSEHRFDELRLHVVRKYDEIYTDLRRPYRRGSANTDEHGSSRFASLRGRLKLVDWK